MDATETEDELKRMLREAGVDLEHPLPLLTWRVFTTFAERKIDGIEPADDGLLFHWGNYEGDANVFSLGFLRQFGVFAGDGAYDHMEQLHCGFTFASTDELGAFSNGESWWFRSETRRAFSDWVAEIEGLPVFDVLRGDLTPVEGSVDQERI